MKKRLSTLLCLLVLAFTSIQAKETPAIMLDDVKNERITNVKADVQKGSKIIIKKK